MFVFCSFGHPHVALRNKDQLPREFMWSPPLHAASTCELLGQHYPSSSDGRQKASFPFEARRKFKEGKGGRRLGVGSHYRKYKINLSMEQSQFA